jgi:hypothetical protein
MTRRSADYMQNAEECRRLARVIVIPEDRDALLNMAAAWENLVQEPAHPDHRPALVKAMDGS